MDFESHAPVGDNKIRNTDIRIIVATNKSLTDMVNNGSMRKDFFYRIDIIPITVPPLRDRKEDIPLLIEHFLQSKGNGKKVPTISGKTIDALCNYDWPGNVRELQNVLQRYLVLKNPNLLKPAVFNNVEQEELSGQESNEDNPKLHATVECFEKTLVTDALNSKGWNRSETAASLGISRKTLFRKMKYFGSGMTQNG